MDLEMWQRLEAIERRYEELSQLLAQPETAQDPEKVRGLGKELASLEETVALLRQLRAVSRELEETRTLLQDSPEPELAELAQEEVRSLEERRERLQEQLQLFLAPADPRDQRDVIMEVRAGTGGEEAALFSGDLFRMYSRYAQSRGWEVEIMDASPSERGGFKEAVFEVRGKGAFSRLKYEAGVHRVQRVPVTEASGRLHTSTATVVVLPRAEAVEVAIAPEELKVEFYRASGPGGQNVNKVSSAVRLFHIPTGIVVQCQEERSQFRNRQKALEVLRARLLERQRREQESQITQERRSQVGTAERAEKIRTYNFPQSRVTDHRLGISLHNLPQILDGELDTLLDALARHQAQQALEVA